KFKAKAGSSVSPTHGALIVSSSGNATATYLSRLHFTRLRDCAQSAFTADVFFRGHSTVQGGGITHFVCNPPQSACLFIGNNGSSGSISISSPWLKDGGGPIASFFPIQHNANDTMLVTDYYEGAGSADFDAFGEGKTIDVFAAEPDGLHFETALHAGASAKGDLDENPAYSF